jgi:hypothetical protein
MREPEVEELMAEIARLGTVDSDAANAVLDEFLYYGFLDQGEYLRFGSISYLDGLIRPFAVIGTCLSLGSLGEAYKNAVFWIPPVTLGLLVAVRLLSGPDRSGRTLVASSFGVAALIGLFPRADLFHLSLVAPPILLVLAHSGRRFLSARGDPWRRTIHVALAVWLAAGFGYAILRLGARAASDGYRLSTLPHFHGPLLATEDHELIASSAERLRQQAEGQTTFLVSDEAGLLYLIAGIDNPTRFDYPLAQVFGEEGQEEVIDALERGAIDQVCLERLDTPLNPRQLETFVLRSLDPAADVGVCTIYRPARA